MSCECIVWVVCVWSITYARLYILVIIARVQRAVPELNASDELACVRYFCVVDVVVDVDVRVPLAMIAVRRMNTSIN